MINIKSVAKKTLVGTLGAATLLIAGTQVANADTIKIQQGDTVWGYSQKYHVSIDSIVKSNKLADANLIIAGHSIDIPGTTSSASTTTAVAATSTTTNSSTVASSAIASSAPASTGSIATTSAVSSSATAAVSSSTSSAVSNVSASTSSSTVTPASTAAASAVSSSVSSTGTVASSASSTGVTTSSSASTGSTGAIASSVTNSTTGSAVAASTSATSATSTSNASTTSTSATSTSTTASTRTSTSSTSSSITRGGGVSAALAIANSDIPYIYGGSTLAGFDCSGLVQYVYGLSSSYRTTVQQAQLGTHHTDVENAPYGSLVFWGSSSAPYHVGISLGNGTYVAAQNSTKGIGVFSMSNWEPSFYINY